MNNKKVSYHLVFTKNIKFWNQLSTNLVLSKFVVINDSNFTNYDYEVIPLPINFYEYNLKILEETISLEELLLKDLSAYLNKLHNEKYSYSEWKIIIGPWLRIFLYTYVTVNKKIDIAFKNYSIRSVSLCIENSLSTTDDYIHFQSKLAEDDSNMIFVSELINNYIIKNGIEIKINNVISSYEKTKLVHDIEAQYNKIRFRDKLRNIITYLYNLIPINNNGPAIFNSFLPFYYDFFLKITNFQSPILLNTYKSKHDNDGKRIKIKEIKNTSINSDLNLILLCINYLPKSYNENFKKIKEYIFKINWPKNPNFIFTSNNHISDDLFKIWAVEKIKNGTKYFIGQHGSGYGTHINPWVYNSLEEQTADKFLIWGESKNKILNHESAFILKSPKLEYVYNSNGNKHGILFIVPTIDHRDPLFHYTYDFLSIVLNNYKIFFSNIHEFIKRDSIIRLRHDNTKSFAFEYEFLCKNILNVNFEFGKIPIKTFVKNFKIIIHAYDSTGFLETLSNDIPTVAFLNLYELDLIKKDVLYDYEILMDKHIIFTDPVKLSDFINSNYLILTEWWYSEEIIRVKKYFIEKYCKKITKPIKTLNNIFHV
jgi:putative transferase (TIGR04331 family)